MSGAEAAIVRGAWVLTMDPAVGPLRDAAVLLAADGSITACGDAAELIAANPGLPVHGDGNGIVLPGFVNAHTHLSECLVTGMAETASLFEWLERIVNPVGAALGPEEMRVGTMLKCVEMLRTGITTVNDMSCHRNLGSGVVEGAVDGLVAMGMRAVVSFGAEDFYADAPPPQAFIAEHERLADHISGQPLIGFRAGIGTVLVISDELFRRTVHACHEHGWGVHTHLAEVREEVTESRIRHGHGTIEQAGRMGLLELPVIAGHCIWCTERDIGLLVGGEVAVAHNPVANMILGSGVCRVPRLLREGVTVGIGTDGAASNDSQDMLGAIKCAALLQKVDALDPAAIDAETVLRMATLGGAQALGLDAEVGSLEPGKRADVVLLDGNTPELAAIHDPFQQVVYCATSTSVSDVWVDGVRRLREGAVIGTDVPALAGAARALAIDLVQRAGLGAESVYAGPGRLRHAAAATTSPSSS